MKYTYDEMLKLKAEWLEQCRNSIVKARFIAMELGTDYPVPNKGGETVRVFSQGRVHFLYIKRELYHLLAKDDALTQTTVAVMIGDEKEGRTLMNRPIAMVSTFNYDGYEETDNFAVPNDEWQQVADQWYEQAVEKVRAREHNVDLVKAKLLARQLWLD